MDHAESKSLSGQLRTKLAKQVWKLTCDEKASQSQIEELAQNMTENFVGEVIHPLFDNMNRWSLESVSSFPEAFYKAICGCFKQIIALKLATMTECVSFDYFLDIDTVQKDGKPPRKTVYVESPGLLRWPQIQNDKNSGFSVETATKLGNFS